MTETIEQRFDALAWHDAILLKLTVDRTNPGHNDEVLLSVEWPDGTRQHLRFSDCYALDARMNFGVIAPESILDADCISDSPPLDEVRQRWEGLGVELADLRCFEIHTNSTASVILIFAREFHLRTQPPAPNSIPA